jgi:hypothetical protein
MVWITHAEPRVRQIFALPVPHPGGIPTVRKLQLCAMNFRLHTAFAIAAAAPIASAHHSIAGVYEGYSQLTLEAIVTEFHFVNPHPRIFVNVEAADGTVRSWTLEMDNRWELAELGFEVETLRPGDRIIVTGNPGRGTDNVLYVRKLERPADGFNYVHHP